MGTLRNFIRFWLPPFLWMFLIFYLSSHRHVSITGQSFSDFIIFKFLHLTEYAILFFLLFRAFYSLKNLTIDYKFLYAILLTILYAVSDEFHQTFTPTREGRIRDVLIDIAGTILMYIYIRLKFTFAKKFLK